MPFPCRGVREHEMEGLGAACEAGHPRRPFRDLSANQDVGGLISLMVPSTTCSNRRPDRLMQDRKAARSMTKRTARAIQMGRSRLSSRGLHIRLSCDVKADGATRRVEQSCGVG
jgi:hypothetical protein